MKGLFFRLFTYRPKDGRTSQEDFFTEAFAGVLQASLGLRLSFVNWLINPLHEVDSVHITTQKTLDDGSRVDIWIEARSHGGRTHHLIAMENKIEAAVDIDQLRRYETQLQLKDTVDTRTRTLICATRYERASLEPSPCGPEVNFRPVCWYEVADQFRRWLLQQPDGHREPGGTLIHELLSLMEEWKMEIHLTADDLAATTRHRTSVERHLLQLLDVIHAECKFPDGQKLRDGQKKWAYSGQYLYYTSKQFTTDMNARAEFGFDFKRDDADWSVPQLGLPSAYFAIRGTKEPKLMNRLKALKWNLAPEEWKEWNDDYLRAKQLNSLTVKGSSLHLIYLDFFRTARKELWQALRLFES